MHLRSNVRNSRSFFHRFWHWVHNTQTSCILPIVLWKEHLPCQTFPGQPCLTRSEYGKQIGETTDEREKCKNHTGHHLENKNGNLLSSIWRHQDRDAEGIEGKGNGWEVPNPQRVYLESSSDRSWKDGVVLLSAENPVVVYSVDADHRHFLHLLQMNSQIQQW